MMLDIGSKSKRFMTLLREERPEAVAVLRGDPGHPGLYGKVNFYSLPGGTLVEAEVNGLPQSGEACVAEVFGFHIHEGKACTGNAEDPFSAAGMHLNPDGCPHPAHMGDMPPLFGNRGYAWMIFFTDRFQVKDVLGQAVIIHSQPDDFRTQPSGDSGQKIACGLIKRR